MTNKKLIALMWILSLLPAVLVALCWARLPDVVPTNWGFNGQVNAYGSKTTLWVMAGLPPLMALLFQFLPRIDPKKANYEKFQGIYGGFAIALMLFLTGTTAIILAETLRPGTLQVGRITMLLVSLFFVVIGCVMGKIKPNWFMGFRTPWALSDPDVWNKTHRLGGWVFFLSGAVTFLLALLSSETVAGVVMTVLLIAGCILTTFMSWKWYRDKQD